MMRVLFKEGAIDDGKLEGCGRIIVHRGRGLASSNNVTDHNNLLRAFAARFRMDRDEVIAQAVRLYFRKESARVVVSGVRQIDSDAVRAAPLSYGHLIWEALSRV